MLHVELEFSLAHKLGLYGGGMKEKDTGGTEISVFTYIITTIRLLSHLAAVGEERDGVGGIRLEFRRLGVAPRHDGEGAGEGAKDQGGRHADDLDEPAYDLLQRGWAAVSGSLRCSRLGNMGVNPGAVVVSREGRVESGDVGVLVRFVVVVVVVVVISLGVT